MSLPLVLNTNEIKDSAGASINFERLGDAMERKLTFFKTGEAPAYQHRLGISHQEIGSGLKGRRRSQVWARKTHISTVDNVTPVTSLFYTVSDIPIGAITSFTEPYTVFANLLSFLASKGASSTILFNGTGYGAECLILGSL